MESKELLSKLAKKSDEHEFYSSCPEGYVRGKCKYVIIFGTVMSGLGKGIFSSALASLLKNKGLKISPLKFDGYLNVDAGTLNPYRHGEVFVLDDGMECDMDLGTYERFLDQNLTKNNYLTGGKLFKSILDREREGKFLGRDVQFIPHVTGEIKKFVRNLAVSSNADIVFVEVGGTVGDIENSYFIESMRELRYEEGKENVCFCTLTYILEPSFLGEQKSKAAQIGIRELMGMGIQPDIVACRGSNPITEKIIEKISIFSNVPVERVVSLHDCKSIYEIPFLLRQEKVDENILSILGISKLNKKLEDENMKQWRRFIDKKEQISKEISIGITGKYTGLRDSYASIINALEHAGVANNVKVKIKWVETTKIEDKEIKVGEALSDVQGIIVPGGFGKRGTEGKIMCIKYARENNLPFLGLCYGFQMAVIEFARNVLKLKDVHTTEIKPDCKNPVIDILPEQKKIEGLGGNMRLGGRDVLVKKGSLAHKLYGSETIRERFRHRYEVDPKYIKQLEQAGMVFSGKAPDQPIMQILELPTNNFYLGTQFHPEFTSRPLNPNPLFFGFVKAALKKD